MKRTTAFYWRQSVSLLRCAYAVLIPSSISERWALVKSTSLSLFFRQRNWLLGSCEYALCYSLCLFSAYGPDVGTHAQDSRHYWLLTRSWGEQDQWPLSAGKAGGLISFSKRQILHSVSGLIWPCGMTHSHIANGILSARPCASYCRNQATDCWFGDAHLSL